MAQLPIIISPTISLLILHLLNRRFNYKAKLVELLGSKITYEVLLIVLYIVSIICFYLVTDTFIFLHPLGITIFAVLLYLSQLPEQIT